MDKDEAARHLEVIRSLMERSVIYRSLSAPGAFLGGLLSLGASAGLALLFADSVEPWVFVSVWIAVLIVTTAFNLSLLGREACRSGRPFFSPAMRTALGLLWPAMAAGGVAGIAMALFGPRPDVVACASLWTLCYGLALSSTRPFSPRSLRRLGHAFTLFGTLALALWPLLPGDRRPEHDSLASSIIMGIGFGLFHLCYAAAVWSAALLRRR